MSRFFRESISLPSPAEITHHNLNKPSKKAVLPHCQILVTQGPQLSVSNTARSSYHESIPTSRLGQCSVLTSILSDIRSLFGVPLQLRTWILRTWILRPTKSLTWRVCALTTRCTSPYEAILLNGSSLWQSTGMESCSASSCDGKSVSYSC